MTMVAPDPLEPSPARLVIEHRGPASRRARAANRVLRRTAHPALRAAARIGRPWNMRLGALSDFVGVVLPPPRGTQRERIGLGDYKAEWVIGPGAPRPSVSSGVVLYFHGGGFVGCGLRTHRRLVARISREARVPVLNVAYRQLPKASVATSVADGIDAYRYLLSVGFRPEDIVVAGDSAGGLIAFQIAIAAAHDGLPMPAGIVGLSPWLELDAASRFDHENVLLDPYMSPQTLARVMELGSLRHGPLDPVLSPVNAELAGLPRALIQVGSVEILRHDAELMAERLSLAGVDCLLQIWDRQPHVFQAGADVLPDARAAITEIAGFVREAITVEAV